jgi:hypothetical protein
MGCRWTHLLVVSGRRAACRRLPPEADLAGERGVIVPLPTVPDCRARRHAEARLPWSGERGGRILIRRPRPAQGLPEGAPGTHGSPADAKE